MTTDSNSTLDIKQHTIWQSIFLHLFPGVLVVVFFILAVPVVKMFGFPVPFALVLAILFVLIPFELGVLFYEGKKLNGRFSLKGIVVYRERIELKQYFIFVPILLVWLIICFALFTSLDNFFIKKLFKWLPEFFIPTNWLTNINKYPLNNRIIVAGLFFVANALAGPIVEEMYFRGYLLPRLSRIKNWAPFINTVLFSIYHFFLPWQQLSRIIGLFPLVYVVSRKKNIYLGICTHCILNSLSTVSMIILIFKELNDIQKGSTNVLFRSWYVHSAKRQPSKGDFAIHQKSHLIKQPFFCKFHLKQDDLLTQVNTVYHFAIDHFVRATALRRDEANFRRSEKLQRHVFVS